jgi:exopolysaccharide biosynthesis protein
MFLGPSETARDQLVISALETSAMKFVPGLYLPKSTIEEIVAGNTVIPPDEQVDPDLIVIKPSEGQDPDGEDTEDDEWADYPDGVRIETVYGQSFRGKVMLIRDPSRVFVGTSSDFKNAGVSGIRVLQAVANYEAAGGINGGGFFDDGTAVTGNLPLTFTMSEGKVVYGNLARKEWTIGLTHDDVLVVGQMTGQQALDQNMRDCVSFEYGYSLIVNGMPSTITGEGNLGRNPRTAIGQRADGVVVMVVIDGRQASSVGGDYADLIDIFMQYGAINAANLDGGTSTIMVYNSEVVNVPSNLVGRLMPTFFLIKQPQ